EAGRVRRVLGSSSPARALLAAPQSAASALAHHPDQRAQADQERDRPPPVLGPGRRRPQYWLRTGDRPRPAVRSFDKSRRPDVQLARLAIVPRLAMALTAERDLLARRDVRLPALEEQTSRA